ncbi:MAG: tight adherence protein [Actinomycetota bacterium]|nr:tight adherence protein [Actinomycetota bacterium]
MPPLELSAGLLAVFTGTVALVVTVATHREHGDPGVRRSLELVGAMPSSRARDVREAELAVPFADRVLGPVLRRFVAAGRRCTPDERMQQLRHRLDLAGNPEDWDADRVVGLKALAWLVGLVLGLLVPATFGVDLAPTVAIAVLASAGGWFAPGAWLHQVARERSARVRRDLPDALDLMTISVEAGLAFDAAMAQVAHRTEGPLAKEFFRVLREMQFGASRTEAMRAFGERTDVVELRAFLGAMAQADELGVPIAGVLRVQAREMRTTRSQRAEELAQKVPIKIVFPLVLCIMPCLFIVVLGPAVLTLLRNFDRAGF